MLVMHINGEIREQWEESNFWDEKVLTRWIKSDHKGKLVHFAGNERIASKKTFISLKPLLAKAILLSIY